MDHINVKLFAATGSRVHWPDLIPVFHRWIRDNVLPGIPIDVADYSHVPEGPGIMLVAHDAFFSVDNRAGHLGFLYNRRTATDGDLAANLAEAYDSALSAARKLELEIDDLRFDADRFEMFVNDRMLAPNNAGTDAAIRPAVEALYQERIGKPASVSLDSSDPRALYRLQVRPSA